MDTRSFVLAVSLPKALINTVRRLPPTSRLSVSMARQKGLLAAHADFRRSKPAISIGVINTGKQPQGWPVMSDGRTHWEGCYKEYGHKDCAVAEIERLTADNKELLRLNGVLADTFSDLQHSADKKIERLQSRVEELEGVLNGLECESEWCGKSPHGTPGKRGYDDGKCQICKALAATEEERE